MLSIEFWKQNKLDLIPERYKTGLLAISLVTALAFGTFQQRLDEITSKQPRFKNLNTKHHQTNCRKITKSKEISFLMV